MIKSELIQVQIQNIQILKQPFVRLYIIEVKILKNEKIL